MELPASSTCCSPSLVPSLLSLESRHRSDSVLNKSPRGRPISYKESQCLNDSAPPTHSTHSGLLKEKYTVFSELYYIETSLHQTSPNQCTSYFYNCTFILNFCLGLFPVNQGTFLNNPITLAHNRNLETYTYKKNVYFCKSNFFQSCQIYSILHRLKFRQHDAQ